MHGVSMNSYGSDWVAGSLIEMFDEKYRIRENFGSCGTVEYLDGTFVTSRFYWEYQGERAILISTPEQQG